MPDLDAQPAAAPAVGTDRLYEVILVDCPPSRSPEVEQERKIAIYDLLEEDCLFRVTPRDDAPPPPPGPYALSIGLQDRRLTMAVANQAGADVGQVVLSISPLRRVIRDYFAICESYFDAIKRLPPSQIEAIDMGRRGVHNDGAQLLIERLDGKIEIGQNTARRLFTLVSVLHYRG